MVIPQAYIDNFTREINVVSEDAQKRLKAALSRVSLDDIASARDQIIMIMETLLAPYSNNVAGLAATFYDGLRAMFGISDGFLAEAVSAHNPEATAGAVRAFMQYEVDGKPYSMLESALAGRIDYELKLTANKCVEENAIADPRRPKWARIPTGAETCAYCLFLASRGFAYNSQDAAHAHANCDCRIVPSWDRSPQVENYADRLRGYERMYIDADNLRRGDMPEELRERLAAAKAEHDRKFAAGETSYKWSSMNETVLIMRYQNPALH